MGPHSTDMSAVSADRAQRTRVTHAGDDGGSTRVSPMDAVVSAALNRGWRDASAIGLDPFVPPGAEPRFLWSPPHYRCGARCPVHAAGA